MPEYPPPTPESLDGQPLDERREAISSARVLLGFVATFTALLSAAHLMTHEDIEASVTQETLRRVEEVLPPSLYDNALLEDALVMPATPALGQSTEHTVYRARLKGQPSAAVVEAIAPDGYAGRIRLILAISSDQKLLGVRVIEHKETPGLGDYIDPRKDKQKANPWISQFTQLTLSDLTETDWRVRKDGGQFDSRTGATITPRAIVKAVHKAEQFVTLNWETLFASKETPPDQKREREKP